MAAVQAKLLRLLTNRIHFKHLTAVLSRLNSQVATTTTDVLSNANLSELNISDSCVQRLKELSKKDSEAISLRVMVDGGGCAGFQYKFEIDSKIESDDQIFEKEGVKVIVDKTSLQYIKGATIEFHQELIRSAFRIVDNPLAQQGCSCGASFNLKITDLN